MMLVRAAALLILAFSAGTPGLAAPIDPVRFAGVPAIAEAEMHHQGMPGMVLVVIEGDEIRLARGFGMESADLTIVVMANRFLFPERIERRLVRHLLSLPSPPHEARPLSADDRRAFAGRFDVGVHGWYPRIEEREGRLWFVLPGPPIAFPLIRVGDDLLAGADDIDGYRLGFSPDRRELRLLGMGLMTWYGRRVEP